MEPIQNILTVSELNSQIKSVMEENFRFVNLIAEISNFKIHTQSGHYYFTLKDNSSQISAVMWRTRNSSLLFTPEDGMQVVIKGRITLYAARGTYQVEVWDIKPQGAGELQLRFEQLKQKLFEEGLFDEVHKKPLPAYPEHIGVITSIGGAALQDFINIVRRRYPVVNLYLFNATVQGNTAAKSVADCIKTAEIYAKTHKLDLIVITRGGGSLEDLWSFNDEKLARAIFSSKIPIVSAVGHEIDFTICDFVADLRASTPSAAAELVTPRIENVIENVDKFSYFYRNFVVNKLESLRNSLKEIEGSYYFNRPKDLINNFYQRIDEISKDIESMTGDKISYLKNQVKHYKKTLHHVSPETNLKKGYAVVYKNNAAETGELFSFKFDKIAMRSKELQKDEDVEIKFYDGKKPARITK